MTDTSPHPDAPLPDVDLERAVALVLERAGPLPPWRVVSVLAQADVVVDADDLDRLAADGVITRVQGPGGADLLALPSTAPSPDWRAAVSGVPPAVAVAATVAVLLVIVLVVMAINGPDASWPAIEWGPPPG